MAPRHRGPARVEGQVNVREGIPVNTDKKCPRSRLRRVTPVSVPAPASGRRQQDHTDGDRRAAMAVCLGASLLLAVIGVVLAAGAG